VKRGDLEARLLVLVTLALVAFGLVMVYSATSAPAAVGGADPVYYLKRQAIYAALGLILLVIAARTNYRKLRALSPLLVVGTLALLAAVLVVADPINGARRWFSFGPAAFQPSELAKLALAVWLAAYLSRRPAPQTLGELARPIGLLVGVVCLLLLAEPDLGTSITIVIMIGGMLVIAGTPLRVLGSAALIVGALGLTAIWIEPYRRARVFAFLDPWAQAQGDGFQTVQALIGMGSGGIWGRGLGEGIRKIFYLPEAHTDMIFAVIGEELGLVGALAVISAYVVFAYAGFRVALAARDPFAKLLAGGITVLVVGQASVNLCAVMGIAPLTGIPLPLVSYGGSSLVVLLASVGVVLNIAHGGGQAEARVRDRSRGDRRARPAVARDRGRTAAAGRARDVGRSAGSRRSAARS
jgi:cell division protein FtsW